MSIENRSDSKWSTPDEFKKNLTKIDLSKESISGGGIPLMSDGTVVYVDNLDSHTLVFGNTGSKKTRLIGMPTLQILTKAGESFIATDPKGELYDKTIGLLNKLEYKTIVLNFREPHLGNSWNPLDLPLKFYKLGEIDKAVELINDLAKNIITGALSKEPFWENAAGDLFSGLALILMECASEKQMNFYSISNLRYNFDTLKKLFDRLNHTSLPYIALNTLLGIKGAEKTRDGILCTFDQHMRIFFYQKNLAEMLSQSDFDLSKIGDEKTALFLIMPDEKNTYHKLISIFIKQCYESLISRAQVSKNRMLKIRTNFLLDEFSNLPAITDFPSMITAARSRNMRITIICQGEHQLVEKYGNEAQTIKGNCSNWIFLTSRELSLLREITELCGRKEDGLELISISKLQRLNKERGEALILNGRKFPYVSTLADIDDYEHTNFETVDIPIREKHKIEAFNVNTYYENHKSDIGKLFVDKNIIMEDDNVLNQKEVLIEEISTDADENRKKELERIKKWIEDRRQAQAMSANSQKPGMEFDDEEYDLNKPKNDEDEGENEIDLPMQENKDILHLGEISEIERQKKLIKAYRENMEVSENETELKKESSDYIGNKEQ